MFIQRNDIVKRQLHQRLQNNLFLFYFVILQCFSRDRYTFPDLISPFMRTYLSKNITFTLQATSLASKLNIFLFTALRHTNCSLDLERKMNSILPSLARVFPFYK